MDRTNSGLRALQEKHGREKSGSRKRGPSKQQLNSSPSERYFPRNARMSNCSHPNKSLDNKKLPLGLQTARRPQRQVETRGDGCLPAFYFCALSLPNARQRKKTTAYELSSECKRRKNDKWVLFSSGQKNHGELATLTGGRHVNTSDRSQTPLSACVLMEYFLLLRSRGTPFFTSRNCAKCKNCCNLRPAPPLLPRCTRLIRSDT